MRTRRRQAPEAPGLTPQDLALCVFGPWDERADCGEAKPTPAWHPRVQPDRLRLLWANHRGAIETAAAAAGVEEAWVVSRLWFVDLVDGR